MAKLYEARERNHKLIAKENSILEQFGQLKLSREQEEDFTDAFLKWGAT